MPPKLVDDTVGKPKSVLLHYARALHHLYEEFLETLDPETRVIMVAPTIEHDITGGYLHKGVWRPGHMFDPSNPHKEHQETFGDLFSNVYLGRTREREPEFPRFEILLNGLQSSGKSIDDVAQLNPEKLKKFSNLELFTVDHYIHAFARDCALYSDGRKMMVGSNLWKDDPNQKSAGNLAREILTSLDFKIVDLDYYYLEGGDVLTNGDVVYIGGNVSGFNRQRARQVWSDFRSNFQAKQHKRIISDPNVAVEAIGSLSKREKIVFPAGIAYHLDQYFKPLGPNTVGLADIEAGFNIMRDMGIEVRDSDYRENLWNLDEALGINVDTKKRIQYLDKLEQELSKTNKVFRVPVFAFKADGVNYFISSLNLISTDDSLTVPAPNVEWYQRILNVFDDIAKHTGKDIKYLQTFNNRVLAEAHINCLVGNLERTYSD